MPVVAERIVPWPAVMPYDKQSLPVPGTKRPGQTGEFVRSESFLVVPLLTRSVASSLSEWYGCL